MLRNYIKTAFRTLLKYKTFSAINLLGLSFSMSVCLLIINIIHDQLSHDTFHKDGDQIYRVISKPLKKRSVNINYATTYMPLAEALRAEAPGIENTVRITKALRGDAKSGEKVLRLKGLFADQAFFEVFNFKLKHGDIHYALTAPHTIVLSEETAYIYFGEINPVGKLVDVEGKGSFKVTGVVKKPTGKSHITFDAIASTATLTVLEKSGQIRSLSNNWENNTNCYLYLKLSENTSPESVEAMIPGIMEKFIDPEHKGQFACTLQSLSDITPSPIMSNMLSQTIPMEIIWFLSILAIVIILSASFNYTNLSISTALTRAKEIGIRKVAGALRKELILQFLIESALYALLSLIIGILLYQFLLGAFNGMSISKDIILNVKGTPMTYLWFLLFSLAVGIVSGLSPAWVMSSFKPQIILKNFSGIKLFSKLSLRKSLIIIQFSFSLFFIVTAIIISRQSKLFINSDYGFTNENIINIKLQDAKVEQYLSVLSSRSDVIQVSASSHMPVTGQHYSTTLRRNLDDDAESFLYYYVDHGYLDNLGLKLLAGSNFSIYNTGNQERQVIINEAGAHKLGFENSQQAIGEHVYLNNSDSAAVQIAGVVKNYNHEMMFTKIRPLVLRNKADGLHYANVKIQSKDIQATLSGLESDWRSLDKIHTFDYQFFDKQLEQTYGFIKDLNGIVGITAFLAIIVSCLGLLGMAIYNAESKVKEVGIRKVMGARILDISYLLSKGFLGLIIIAICATTPLAFFVNNLWLQMIAYRISLGFDIFLIGILILLGMGVITICSQALRVAFGNPVDSLRSE